MNIKKIYAIYFSPTHGTKQYVEKIAGHLSPEFEVIDLTSPTVRHQNYVFEEDDLVIIGAPVYAGRLPSLQEGLFQNLHGNNTPAIFTVSYGNREFEDALLEEKEICEANGFVGIAAASWIAPHTFSSKVASGRPDDKDEQQIELFAKKVKETLNKNLKEISISVPGNHPYKPIKLQPFHPYGNDTCNQCGLCASVCPTGAIDPNKPKETDIQKCINCFACVKTCPNVSRETSAPEFSQLVSRLETLLTKTRKEPEFFF